MSAAATEMGSILSISGASTDAAAIAPPTPTDAFHSTSGNTLLPTADGAAVVPVTHLSNVVCRFFQRGVCRFGNNCRYSHDIGGAGDGFAISDHHPKAAIGRREKEEPCTSRKNWANAPVFVPTNVEKSGDSCVDPPNIENLRIGDALTSASAAPSWADIVGGGSGGLQRSNTNTNFTIVRAPPTDAVCPFESPCPYGNYCVYKVHLELCHMCDQFCLNPKDAEMRRKHTQECLKQHEQAMELSFAIARSKDKTCGICFDTIMEKSGREKRFGILPNCSHIFCLECIRKWRQAKQFEHKITRACPECRVSSDFVCPSAFWVDTKEEKHKLLTDYRQALGIKDCKYFKKGDGKCPFGNKCFYKHALPNGDLVDVGCPKRSRKLQSSPSEIIDMLDIYLWEFVEQRDYHWLDFMSSTTDDSEDSDWSEH